METNLKKLLPIVGVVCLSLTQVFADYDSTSNVPPTQMAVPPSPTPGETGPNVFIGADYTLWTARESGLAVATSNYYPSGTTVAEEGKVFYPKMKLNSGFKVDLGVYLPHDNWDVKAEYTWFNNNNNDMHEADFTSGTALSTFFPKASAPVELAAASSSWNNWFNRIDLTMGRSFFAGHYLAIRPFMGLLGAWDNQKLDAEYTELSTLDQYNLSNSQKWWGVGAYGGINATFTFVSDSSNQWSLFLDAGTALPWSKFNGKQSSYNKTDDLTYYSVHNSSYLVTSMLETALGIRWETWWADGSWMFLLQAAWEEQVWFNHNNFVTVGSATSSAGNGAYTMQGLTVKAAIAF
jgi:Legionella pneumophila major outer membrane protein precursor